MPGSRVSFIGDAMATVVQGIIEVRTIIGLPPVVVGGGAVLSRLSNPYRATVDFDVVDRLLGDVPHLEVLRAADGAQPVQPSAVLLNTPYGTVKVDVLEVRQAELDTPSDDAGCQSPNRPALSWLRHLLSGGRTPARVRTRRCH